MSNPTNPFNWQMPQPTDLVTDLPADFEVFGQAVATSMADLLGGTTGQILSKATNTDMDFVWTDMNPGDITGVTAGTGISGGGTSGTVTVTNSMATAIDAKGDLIAGTGADAFSRVPIGADNLFLQAASTETSGMKWGGTWTSWTPTWTNLTVGNGTVTASYVQIGKVVTVKIALAWGSTTAITGAFLRSNLPVNAETQSEYVGFARYFDTGTQQYNGMVALESSSTIIFAVLNTNATFSGYTDVNATTPMTWTNTDYLTTIFTYRAA